MCRMFYVLLYAAMHRLRHMEWDRHDETTTRRLWLMMFTPHHPCPINITSSSSRRCNVLYTSFRRAAATICPRSSPPPWAPKRLAPPSRRRNVAAVSHGQHVPTPAAAAAWRANTAVGKAAWWPWPVTFWSWKWCPSHVWRGLPLCQSTGLSVLDLGPDVRDRRQTTPSLYVPAY